MLYICVSTFSFCLRPTNSVSESLPFKTRRYSQFVLLPHILSFSLFSSLLPSFSLFLFFFPSRFFQSSVGEKYIFVHGMKPLSPTPSSSTRNTLFSSYSLTHTFSLSLLFTMSDLRSTTKPDFRERTLENTWIRVERSATENVGETKRGRSRGKGNARFGTELEVST